LFLSHWSVYVLQVRNIVSRLKFDIIGLLDQVGGGIAACIGPLLLCSVIGVVASKLSM
jgi:hypothetical protein